MINCKLLAECLEACHILFPGLIHFLLQSQPFCMQFLVAVLLPCGNIRHIRIDLTMNKNNVGTELVHEVDHIVVRLAFGLNQFLFPNLQLVKQGL